VILEHGCLGIRQRTRLRAQSRQKKEIVGKSSSIHRRTFGLRRPSRHNSLRQDRHARTHQSTVRPTKDALSLNVPKSKFIAPIVLLNDGPPRQISQGTEATKARNRRGVCKYATKVTEQHERDESTRWPELHREGMPFHVQCSHLVPSSHSFLGQRLKRF
jgi:hypothetical protein